jgi:hypothetical protein
MQTYDQDVVAWANEQARLLRAGRFDLLDIEHIAEEIEDVGKSEQRELSSRMAVLLAHLLKWKFQQERQCASWKITIRIQRKDIDYVLKKTPSLRPKLADPEWLENVWGNALLVAIQETGMSNFPDTCPWAMDDILRNEWMPD